MDKHIGISPFFHIFGHVKRILELRYCGGTGTESTVPTNTVQVPITMGTVTDSGSEYTGFINDIGRYIYRTGEL